jgi:hypothetical protein
MPVIFLHFIEKNRPIKIRVYEMQKPEASSGLSMYFKSIVSC